MDGFGRVSWWGFSPALDLTALHGQGMCVEYVVTIRLSDIKTHVGPSNVSVDWVDYTCTAKSGIYIYMYT